MSQTTTPPQNTASPALLGRNPEDPGAAPCLHSSVVEAARATFGYTTGAAGNATATIYRSEQNLDRGGMVLRLAIDNSESSFLPTATLTPEGVDIHIAGEAEAEAMVIALQTALLKLNADRARTVGVQMD